MPLRDVARLLDAPHSVVSYWETGKRVPRMEDVGSYLTAIRACSEDRDRILDLARGAREPNWLAAGVPNMTNGLAGVLECERTAETITQWSPMVVPGLLQTPKYARTIISAGEPSSLEVDAQALLRTNRREFLNRRDPARASVIIGEGALRLRVGGSEVLAEQLRFLLQLDSELNSLSIQVVRGDTGWHPGAVGPFVLYEFPDSPPIVYIEHHRSGAFLYEKCDLADYRKAAAGLRTKTAMSPEDSARPIAHAIDELEVTQ